MEWNQGWDLRVRPDPGGFGIPKRVLPMTAPPRGFWACGAQGRLFLGAWIEFSQRSECSNDSLDKLTAVTLPPNLEDEPSRVFQPQQ